VATAAAPYGLLFGACCGFGAYVLERVADGGLAVLGRGLLLPAALMVALLLVGAVAGAASVLRQLAATRRLAGHVARCRMSPPAGTPVGVDVVDHDDPFAFTFGVRDARVALSRGLVERLSAAELDAVVAHERYHVRARDPLKLVVGRAAAHTCFFLPAVGHLVGRYVAGRELAADRMSLRDVGRPALAGALCKVVAGPGWAELDMAAAMAGPDLLAARIEQLEHGTEPALPRLPVASVAVSALVLATLGAIVTAVAVQGGMPMMGDSRDDALAAGDVAGVVLGGMVCAAAWVWLSVVAFRRLAGPSLTARDARVSTTVT